MTAKIDQKTYERTIVEKFIERMEASLEIEDDSAEAPDFILRHGNEVVGLELASYREQGPHNKVHNRDWDMRQFIGNQWIDDEAVNHLHLYLSYLGSDKDHIPVPPKARWPILLKELKAIARHIGPHASGTHISVSFLTEIDQEARRLFQIGGTYLFENDKYPVLSSHFEEIEFRYESDLVFDRPHTSASGRFTGADTGELNRMLGKHLLRVPGYRGSLPNGAQLWLLIHSDGWPPAAHIANDRIRDELYAAARAAVTAPNVDRFDAVWWLDDAHVKDAGTLHRIA